MTSDEAREAIEVLEVAKAEVEWNYPLNYAILCPLCRQEIKAESIDNMFYCPNCGQRIDVIINKTPEKLYGIKNTNTGEVVFNARGVPYHTYDAALKRLRQLDEDKYTIVTYKISDNN